jgi:hypothetical protein
VLLLRSSSLHPRNLLHYEATSELLAKAMSLILLGDYASFCLAMLNEVDPTSTHAINLVKQYLTQSAISSD